MTHRALHFWTAPRCTFRATFTPDVEVVLPGLAAGGQDALGVALHEANEL
jgi:hypothetical protein